VAAVRPLDGIGVVNLGVNLPPDAAAHRLSALGATVTKVEPPAGDPMIAHAPTLYRELTTGQDVVRLDLKDRVDRDRLHVLLARADVLITATRPSALARLGLAPDDLARHARLVHVAIVGHAAPAQETAGHDLTYLAPHGLLAPPGLPPTLAADLAGAERAATAAAALLVGRERGGPRHAEVALEDAARFLALPLVHGVTARGALLGGGNPFYGLYETAGGWVAVAALEPHFRARLIQRLELEKPWGAALRARLRERDADAWERWAREQDLPLAAVHSPT
jgi:crotonobetainyl-CoA:carnitine CoA-transferase CaiB-like acyl-CoA transferase